MKVHVTLGSVLKRFVPDGGAEFDSQVADGITLDQLRESLNLPDRWIGVMIVNGRVTLAGAELREGDEVVFLGPPLAGG